MIKRKTVFTAVVIGAGVIAVIDRIKLFSNNTDKQIESIQEEIGSVYEHMAELSKEKEDGR